MTSTGQLQLDFSQGLKLTKMSPEAISSNMDEKKESLNQKEFLQKWLVDYRWLEYDKALNLMYCKWCKADNALTKGCNNFRKTTLDDHIITRGHSGAVKKFDSSMMHELAAPKDHKSIEEIIMTQKEKLKYELMVPLFRTVYWLAKEDIALLKVESLNRLMELNGVEFIEAYRNRISGNEIMNYIAAYFREELVEELKDSLCFGISFDCSQDISTAEQLIITVKYLTSCSQVEEKFFKLTTLTAKDSESIFQKIKAILVKENLFYKLVAVSTDREPKMVGRKNKDFYARVKYNH